MGFGARFDAASKSRSQPSVGLDVVEISSVRAQITEQIAVIRRDTLADDGNAKPARPGAALGRSGGLQCAP